ncbi:MAG: GntR family transcriptional regulator [Deltaproteobacteria bacterium]|nr:GntR family transcriptional regulator [Deltaproteobacteria bacterium]MBW1816206.1 GntR family transcriptional regulator [Deltaproteobacteria bacterium]
MLNLHSLRKQIYQYLRRQMHEGDLIPGSTLDLNRISRELGVSKTPLRDALIQLDVEGFVTILPRRGVRVNVLTLDDIENIYEILGALETSVISSVFHKIDAEKLIAMERINADYRRAALAGDTERIYRMNLSFHDAFLSLSGNAQAKRLIELLKQRLYDFPRRAYISKWELKNAADHLLLIEHIRKGDVVSALGVWKDRHWSYAYQETYIRRFYALGIEEYKSEMAQLKGGRGEP